MKTSLPEQIAIIREITDTDTLWRRSCDYFQAAGAEMISYRHFIGRVESEDTENLMLVTKGFPKGLVEALVADRLVLVNPIPEIASRMTDPFFWSDIPALTELLEGERAFLQRIGQFQIGDGLAIQVFGPSARNGILNLGFGGTRPDYGPRELKELQLAAQLSHLAYIRLTPDYVHGAKPITQREREVLEWIAKGKSNSVIADILGISVHTVDTHVRRIFRKLDVNDRTTAAVKGLGAGLVTSAA